MSTLISPACLSPVELDWASPPSGLSDDFWLTAPTGDSHPWLWYVHKELSFKAIMEKFIGLFYQGNRIPSFTVTPGCCRVYMFQPASVVLRGAEEKQPSGFNLPLLQWISFRGLLRKT